MMKKYYELLTTDILIKASDLIPKINERTLLYGFDNDTKEKFHVFLKGQEIYAFRGTKPVKIKHNFQFVQNVTLYPEACDFTFCRLLICHQITLPFLPWNAKRAQVAEEQNDIYWGYIG